MATKYNKYVTLKSHATKAKKRIKAKSVILESKIEQNCNDFAKELGIIVRKYSSPAFPSVPDRLYFFSKGVMVLIEYKRPGRKLSIKQAREIHRLIAKGHLVYAINNTATGVCLIESLFRDIEGGRAVPAIKVPTEAELSSVTVTKGKRIIIT